jgi:lipid A 3-O-deacylase
MNLKCNLRCVEKNAFPCPNHLATVPKNIRLPRLKISRSFDLIVLAVLLFGIAIPKASADAPAKTSDPTFNFDSGRDQVWEGAVGDGFHKHAGQVGIVAGGGYGLRVFGGRRDHDVAFGAVDLGTMISGPVCKDHFWHGNFELLGDFFGGAQFNGHTAYIVGLAPILRYNFATGTRFVPFVGGGAGATLTDIRKPDLSTDFEFNVQVGIGMHWFIKPHLAATLEGRWLHLSNAGIDSPNQGVNTSMLLIGANWFF